MRGSACFHTTMCISTENPETMARKWIRKGLKDPLYGDKYPVLQCVLTGMRQGMISPVGMFSRMISMKSLRVS